MNLTRRFCFRSLFLFVGCTPRRPPILAVKESELLSSVRERYTTVKRLVVTPALSKAGGNLTTPEGVGSATDVFVEVQFTGPQPSEGPGALLCDLLCGGSVDAQPVELPRGRKKRPRSDAASSEASDSGECCVVSPTYTCDCERLCAPGMALRSLPILPVLLWVNFDASPPRPHDALVLDT